MSAPVPVPALASTQFTAGNVHVARPAPAREAGAGAGGEAENAKFFGPPLPDRAMLDEIRHGHFSGLAIKRRDICKPADVPAGGTFYCACSGVGKNDGEWGNMVGCDGGCDAWFHYTCVGQLDYDKYRSERQEMHDESWMCPECKMEHDSSKGPDPAWSDKIDHPLTQARTDILQKVLDDMRKYKCNSSVEKKKTTGDAVFHLSPDRSGYGPDFNFNYRLMIPEPMDFETVGNRLKEGGYYPRENQYLCARAFDRDMLLIFDNCQASNKQVQNIPPQSDKKHYTEIAVKCEERYNALMKTALAKLRKTPNE